MLFNFDTLEIEDIQRSGLDFPIRFKTIGSWVGETVIVVLIISTTVLRQQLPEPIAMVATVHR